MKLWLALSEWQRDPSHRRYRPRVQAILENSGSCPEEGLVERLAEEALCFRKSYSHVRGMDLAPLEMFLLRGGRLGILGREGYPMVLRECADPPLTLSFLGDPGILNRRCLSVVGSREPDGRSLEWMERELWSFCRRTRTPLVSGGARGIDQKAHAVALRAGVGTAVFLPSGLDRLYPRDLESWVRAVVDGGGVFVSEYPLGMEMRKAHFHHRNRLIAAAGRMTLIIEARIKGGTMLTAARAAETGRPLLVIPGHPEEMRFSGNLSLLSEGATLVRQSEDLTLFWQAEEISSLVEGVNTGAFL